MPVWPYEESKLIPKVEDRIRPFRVIMFMPFKSEFDSISSVIKKCVIDVISGLDAQFGFSLPLVERIDWVKESGVIHDQIWRALSHADLVFCDISGYNPNVMFELGVAAGWKECKQVILIKDKNQKQVQQFDISPLRYFEYDQRNVEAEEFLEIVKQLIWNVVIGFPDQVISSEPVTLPFEIDFANNREEKRIYTPPFCHRRLANGILEFGSLYSYPHSWASIGNLFLLNCKIQAQIRFANNLDSSSKIAISLRSEHFYANFGHLVILGFDGSINITILNNNPPHYYHEMQLRKPQEIDPFDSHYFEVSIDRDNWKIQVDDFVTCYPLINMLRVNGPGLVRFHATRTWMGIRSIRLSEEVP